MLPVGAGNVFHLDGATTAAISGELMETFHFQGSNSCISKFWTYNILSSEGGKKIQENITLAEAFLLFLRLKATF